MVVQKRSIHTHDYLVQNFYTSKNAKGLFVMDLHHNRPMFIKEVVNDMDNDWANNGIENGNIHKL